MKQRYSLYISLSLLKLQWSSRRKHTLWSSHDARCFPQHQLPSDDDQREPGERSDFSRREREKEGEKEGERERLWPRTVRQSGASIRGRERGHQQLPRHLPADWESCAATPDNSITCPGTGTLRQQSTEASSADTDTRRQPTSTETIQQSFSRFRHCAQSLNGHCLRSNALLRTVLSAQFSVDRRSLSFGREALVQKKTAESAHVSAFAFCRQASIKTKTQSLLTCSFRIHL